MRTDSSDTPVYKYCDFQFYIGVSTCEQLTSKYHVSKPGYYRFGKKESKERHFRFCQPVFRGIYTCEKLKHIYWVKDSGYYMFATGDPFRVYCNFTSGKAVTEIRHNLLNEMQLPGCEERGCYSGMPLYDAGGDDLKRIVDNSVSCKQFIKLRCRGSLINNGRDGPHHWWTSRDGEKILYWGGSRKNGYCACGITNSCIDKSKKCNCDQNSPAIVTSDEGYLTDKSKLPLKEMRAGDMGDATEIAWHTIGKLECSGQVAAE